MARIAARDLAQVNGCHRKDSALSITKLVDKEQDELGESSELSPQHDLVLKTFRLLIADLCQQFNGGHGGYVPKAAIEKRIL
jgi:dihydroxyacetone synthase